MAVSQCEGEIPPQAGAVCPRPGLAVHDRDDPGRYEVEDFIRGIFARRYGADIRHFAPILISLRDRGEIVAAAGYRSAAEEPLFLECYLPSPVEGLLVSPGDIQPARCSVVEVGNLAASRAGEGRRLIDLLGPHLAAQGFQWVVGTITAELRHLFIRMGITPQALVTADPVVLGPSVAQWGSYYDHRPVVLAGNLGQALRNMAARANKRRPA